MYAVMLDMKDKHVVIVGGGKVATRKANSLSKQEAYIQVVAPEFTAELYELEKEEKVHLVQKQVERKDIESAFLIIVATNNNQVNRSVVQYASPHQLVNVVDNPDSGNLTFPAQFCRGKLAIAISTGGASPLLAKELIEDFKQRYDNSYEEYVDFLYECRMLIKASSFDVTKKRELLQEVLQEDYRYSFTLQNKFLQKLQQASFL
ncbi:NAD(P)-binding protein [Bacillus sp. CGMCC 1.16541]|uniref:NAD(P)-binding protein n=1 Tax=Bacillus sp. CGMCC 1.16541 TaxID=2185143 RepID=UPI000D736DF4|nr:NAD(P)-binding protein [Bacillus sp. CGMCC 1.16541]